MVQCAVVAGLMLAILEQYITIHTNSDVWFIHGQLVEYSTRWVREEKPVWLHAGRLWVETDLIQYFELF